MTTRASRIPELEWRTIRLRGVPSSVLTRNVPFVYEVALLPSPTTRPLRGHL